MRDWPIFKPAHMGSCQTRANCYRKVREQALILFSSASVHQQNQWISSNSTLAATVHQQHQHFNSNSAAATLHQQPQNISASAASAFQQHQLNALEGISAHIHQSIQVISAYKHWHHQTPPDMHQTPPDTTRHAPDTTRHYQTYDRQCLIRWQWSCDDS